MKKTSFSGAVLVLVREQPGQTISEIARAGASWKEHVSLLFTHPAVARALALGRVDFRTSLSEKIEQDIRAASSLGYIFRDSSEHVRITSTGQNLLREHDLG